MTQTKNVKKFFLDNPALLFFIINKVYRAPLVTKVLKVIEAIVEEKEDLRLCEIAKRTGINRATVYGILLALQREGLISKDPEKKTYSPSKNLIEFGKKILMRLDIRSIARPFLERLRDLFDETVFLGIRQGDWLTILDVLEAKKPFKITSPVGTQLPLIAGATGKVALSFLEEQEVRDLIRRIGLRKFSEKSIVDEEEFVKEVRRAKEDGFSFDLEEYIKGVWACCAPIVYDGRLFALIWIVGFTSFLEERRIPEIENEVRNTAKMISLAFESIMKREERNG